MFHIRKDGTISRCKYTKQSCRVASSEKHFSTQDEARYFIATNPASVEDRQFLNKFYSPLKRFAKERKCLVCGSLGRKANSHTIPRSALELLCHPSQGTLLKTDFFIPSIGGLDTSQTGSKIYVGIDETLTFKLLCEDCENLLFREYENNYQNIKWNFTGKALVEIVLKNLLYRKQEVSRLIHGRKVLTEIPDSLEISNPLQQSVVESMSLSSEVMYTVPEDEITLYDKWIEDSVALIKDKEKTDSDYHSMFSILFEENLSFRVPLAAQGFYALVKLPDDSISRQLETVNILVLPTLSNTRILIFTSSLTLPKIWQQFSRKQIIDWLWSFADHPLDSYAISVFSENKSFYGQLMENSNPFEKEYRMIDLKNVRGVDWKKLESIRPRIDIFP